MGTPDIIPEQSPQVSWISQAELAAKLALIKEQQEPKNQSLIDAKQCVPNLQKESVPMESLAKHLAMAKNIVKTTTLNVAVTSWAMPLIKNLIVQKVNTASIIILSRP